MADPVRLRHAQLEDASALLPLVAELGYEVTEKVVRENLRRVAHGPTDRVWIAERDGRIVGLVSVHLIPLFHAPGYLGRVTSLVVVAPARGQGIGRLLMEQAEAFCWGAGCERIELTSGDHRPEAHRFYEALGLRVHARRFLKHRPGGPGAV